MWIVKQTNGFLPVAMYGPFKNEAEAKRFAGFVSQEIDPAYVDYLHPDTVVDLQSPVTALLNWHDHAKDRTPNAAMRCPHSDFDDPTHCPCIGGAQ